MVSFMTVKLLTCPRCSSAFRLPSHAIAEGGREVRCSACKHEWLALPLDLRPDPHAPSQVSDEPLTSNASPEDAASTPMESFEQEVSDFSGESFTPTQDDSFEHMTFDGFDTPADVPMPKKQAIRGSMKWLYAANAACFLLAVIVSGLLLRDKVTAFLPVAEPLYHAIGFDSTAKMQLSDISFSRSDRGDMVTYRVMGKIVNHTDKTAPIPTIRARLFTESGEMLKEWVLSSPDFLKAGESRAFHAKNLKNAYKSAYMLAVEIGSPVELMLRE
jgi:predicted Zn finger-like uncharacterized protein